MDGEHKKQLAMQQAASPEHAVHILYSCSDAYAVPAGISIYSLLKNNRHIQDLHIHLIGIGMRPETAQQLSDVAARFGRQLEWIDGKPFCDIMEKAGCQKYHDSYANYLKIFAPAVVLQKYPQAKNLMYIDSDTLVVGSLADISDMELNENDIAGVYELMHKSVCDRIGIHGLYINSGVMVMNLKKWQEHRVDEKIMSALKDEQLLKKLVTAEQDLLNILLEDSIQRLPLKYNVTTYYYFMRPASKYARKQKIQSDFYSDEECEEAFASPAVIHYIDTWTGRPWDMPNANPFTQLFEQYKAEVFPEESIPGRQTNGIRKIAKQIMVALFQILPPSVMGEIIRRMVYIVVYGLHII